MTNNAINSYLILAPAAMTEETDQKKGAFKCFDSIGLDPDSYRIGHTKARTLTNYKSIEFYRLQFVLFPFLCAQRISSVNWMDQSNIFPN